MPVHVEERRTGPPEGLDVAGRVGGNPLRPGRAVEQVERDREAGQSSAVTVPGRTVGERWGVRLVVGADEAEGEGVAQPCLLPVDEPDALLVEGAVDAVADAFHGVLLLPG